MSRRARAGLSPRCFQMIVPITLYSIERPILRDAEGDRDNINISVESRVLTVEGAINFGKYEGLQPVYREYNVVPFRRSLRISSRIDQDKINAEMRDGVITLVLPKVEEAKGENRLTRPGSVIWAQLV
jgi:Hsp20/alpha crystallin family